MRGLLLAFAAASMLSNNAVAAGADLLTRPDEDFASAQTLVTLCGAPVPDPDQVEKARIFCHGYLSGVMQFHQMLSGTGVIPRFVCPTHRVTRRELAGVLLAWADGRTDLETMPAARALLLAAQARWSCG